MKVDYWDDLADRFSERVFEVSERDVRGVIRKTARRLGSKRATAVDFGCGVGASTRAVAPFFKHVLGVDFSEKLLRVAREKTSAGNVAYRRADLAKMNPQQFRCDVAFCFNVLLSPDDRLRRSIAANVVRAVRRGGAGVFIAPSLESELRSYQVVLDCRTRAGFDRRSAAKEVDASARRDLVSLSQGVVDLGGAPTKHFFQDEFADLLTDCGFKDVVVSRIHYPWDVVLDDAPDDIAHAEPWDWIAVGAKA